MSNQTSPVDARLSHSVTSISRCVQSHMRIKKTGDKQSNAQLQHEVKYDRNRVQQDPWLLAEPRYNHHHMVRCLLRKYIPIRLETGRERSLRLHNHVGR